MVKIQIPGLILFFAILLISDLSMAKKNWFITVNIGQHYNLNFIEEENISSRQIKKIFNPLPDQIFHAEYYRELTELLNKWQIHENTTIPPDFKNDPFFTPNEEKKIEFSIYSFSKDSVNVFIFSGFGSSRWHNYNILLKNLLIPRNRFIDRILNLRYYDKLYCGTFKNVKYGTKVSEMENILGTEYYEYAGQSIQLRNIYYEKYNIAICIQDEIVKYVEKGKPAWMESDSVKINMENDE